MRPQLQEEEKEEASSAPNPRCQREVPVLAPGPPQADGSRAGLGHSSGSCPGFVTGRCPLASLLSFVYPACPFRLQHRPRLRRAHPSQQAQGIALSTERGEPRGSSSPGFTAQVCYVPGWRGMRRGAAGHLAALCQSHPCRRVAGGEQPTERGLWSPRGLWSGPRWGGGE